MIHDNLVFDEVRFEQFVEADVRSSTIFSIIKEDDVIIHCAATSALPECEIAPTETFDNNLNGTLNVIEAMRTNNAKRLIFISTSAVYENNKEEIFSENLSVKPNFTYAMSKRAAEIACIGYEQNYGLDIVIPRFFNVFGEHQDIQRKMPPFTGYLVREVLAGRTPHLFNKSPAKRDYVNVHDVKALLTEMVQSPKRYCGEIFNVCSGAGHSVPEIVKCLGTILGVR